MKPKVFGMIAFSCFLFSAGAARSEGVKCDLKDPVAVATAGYKNFLQGPLKQKEYCAEHGLTQEDQNATITLGKPYQLHSMTPDHIRAYKAGMPVSSLVEKTNIYMFPVLFNGQAKLFLDVAKFDKDVFEISCLGESALCREIASVEALQTRSASHSLQLIQNYQTGRYLFHLPQVSQENLTFFEFKPSAERQYSQLSPSSKTMERMRTLLEEKMK